MSLKTSAILTDLRQNLTLSPTTPAEYSLQIPRKIPKSWATEQRHSRSATEPKRRAPRKRRASSRQTMRLKPSSARHASRPSKALHNASSSAHMRKTDIAKSSKIALRPKTELRSKCALRRDHRRPIKMTNSTRRGGVQSFQEYH